MNADDLTPTQGKGLYTPRTAEPVTAAAPQRRAFMPVSTEAPTSPTTGANPTTGATPTTGTTPTTGANPTTGATPTASVRQEAAPTTGSFRTAAPSTGSIPQRTAVRPQSSTEAIPTTPATQSRPAFTATGAPAPVAEPQPKQQPTRVEGAIGAGSARIKGMAGRAAESFKAGDDLGTPASSGGPRRARVLLSRIDPWSALKLGFLMSIALGIMLVVAVFVVWNVLNGMGVFALINEWVVDLFTSGSELDIMQFFDRNKVMSAAILVSVVNVVLITALSTLAAFLYNVVSSIVGGVYVTLTDD